MPGSTRRWRCAPRNDLKPAEIERVTLGLPRAGMMLIGQPAEKKAEPARTWWTASSAARS